MAGLKMFKIVQDTREKIPLDFSFYSDCTSVEIRKLDTGDYSAVGYEDKVYIERKRSTSEIAINFGTDNARWYRELERMSKVKFKYVVCEFSVEDVLSFPKNSGIPKEKWKGLRFNGKYLYKIMKETEAKYNVKFLFCNDAQEAAEKVFELLKRVVEYYEVPF